MSTAAENQCALMQDTSDAANAAVWCNTGTADEGYAAGVRGIAFPANGDCLLAAMQDGLKVWAYEPVRRLDTVEIPWCKVCLRMEMVMTLAY